MAESGGTRIGTMIAEIDLDARRYDAGLRQALSSANTTTQTVEQAWRRMGTGSTETIDRMRANVVRSYETIRNSATSTAADRERAEAAAMARLEQINRRYYGGLTSQMRAAEAQAQRSTSVFNQMFGAFSLANIATSAIMQMTSALQAFASDIVQAQLRVEAMTNAMTAITGSGTLAKDSMLFVSQTARTLGLDIVSLEGAYKNLAGSAMGTSLAGKETERIFTAVSKASAVLGLSADQTQGALYAIGQMMSKGTVQSEELKGQLAERLPGAFQMAARAMGVTTGQLQKMLEKGEVLSNDLIPKLANELEKTLGGSAEKAGNTARAAFENFGNAIEDFKRALANSGIVEYLAKIVSLATSVVNAITRVINGPTADDTLKANTERLIKLRQEEAKASSSEIAALKEKQRNSMANSFGGGRSPLSSNIPDGQTLRQKEIESLEKANRLLLEQNKLKQAERDIAANQTLGAKDRETKAIIDEKAAKEAEKAGKKAASSAESEAKRAAKEAIRDAETLAKEKEQINDDYLKTMSVSYDYERTKAKEAFEYRKSRNQDISENTRQLNFELKVIDDKQTEDFSKNFEELTRASKDEAEQRAKDAADALEQQRQDYEDFVYDVTAATSDAFMELFDGGFSSFFDEVESMFKRTIANLAAEAIAKPIIIPVIQSVAGTVGSDIATAMGLPPAAIPAGTQSGFNLSNISSASNIFSALSGGIEAGAYKALTSGMLGSAGSNLFGSAWLGTGTVMPTAVPGVMTASGAAATAGAAGLGGIASTLSAAAPYIAAAVAAYSIIAPMLEDEPEPFLRVQSGTKADMESRGYKFDIGEGQSNAGYGYNLTMQDIDDPARKEFGTAITKMLDAQMKGIEDALDVSVNDAITIAQARAGQYGAGFFSKVDLRDYEGDIEGALKALSDDLFTDIQSDLVNQLKDSSGTALAGQGGIFDADFFSGISVDGESAVDTFLRFGSVIQDTDSFMSEFTHQMSEFGASSIQAYNNVATLSAVDTAFQTAIDGFNSNTLIDNLKAIDDSYDKTIVKMNQLNATAEDLATAEAARQVDKWKAMTGIDANSITSAIWNDLNTTGASADFVGNIASQVRDALKQAVMTSMIATTITPLITSMIGSSFDGVNMSDPVAVKKASDNLDKSLTSNSELTTSIETLTTVFQSLFGGATASTSSTLSTTTADTSTTSTGFNSFDLLGGQQAIGKTLEEWFTEGVVPGGFTLPETMKDAADKAKELAETLKDLADYLDSNSTKTGLYKSSVAALQSAMENYTKYATAINDPLSTSTFTASDILSASIYEAMTPAIDALSSAFDSVGAFAYTDTERAVASISNSFADLRGSLTYLQNSLAPLNAQIDGLDLSGFFTQANQMLDLLEKAELMQIVKADLKTIGEAKAQIWGLEDTFKLQQFGTKYDVEQLQYAGRSMDSKTLDNIRFSVEAYASMSYSQLLAFADSYGVSVEEFTSDILSLNEILKETSDEFKTLRDSLKDYADKLLLSDVADTYLSPLQKTQMSAKELAKIYIDAMSSDTVKQQTAMGKLPTAADDYLKFAKASTTDMYAYNRDVATVLSRVRQIQEEASGKVVEDIASLQLTEAEGQTSIQNLQLVELKNISADIGAIDKWNNDNIRDNNAIDKFFTDFPTLLSNFEFKTLQTSNEYLITALQGMDWKSIFSAQNTFPTGLDLKLPDGFLTALTNYPVEFNKGVDALIKELQNSFGNGTATTTEAGKSVQGLLGKYKDDAIGINLSDHQGNTLLTKSTLDDLIAYKGTVSNLTSRGLFNGTNAESSSTTYLSDIQFLIDELSKPFAIFEKYADNFGFDVSTIQISSEAIAGLQAINSDSATLLSLAKQSGETSETFIRDMFALSKYMDSALTTSSTDLNKKVVLSGGSFGSTVTGAGNTFRSQAIEAGDSFKLDSILAGVTLTGSATTAALSLTTSATAAGKTLTDKATTSMTTWSSGVQLSADKMISMSSGVSNAIGVSGNSFSTLAVTAGNSLSSVLSTAGGAFGMQIAAAAGVGAGAITDAQTKAAKLVADAQAAASKRILEIQTSATASIVAAQQAAAVPQTQTGINQANTFKESDFQMQLLSFPKYASGGYHAGGLRIVGEAGPELEYTPPSRIFSNSDTKNIFDISELVAENKKLNAEMKEIKRYMWQMTVNTKIAADNLDNFNENGMTVSVAA